MLGRPDLARPDDPWVAAALALGLMLEHKDAEARATLDRVTALLDARADEDRQVTDFLRASDPPALDAIRRAYATPPEKAVLLAILAARFPAHAAEYRAEAARFNVRRFPPYLLVRQAVEPTAPPQP